MPDPRRRLRTILFTGIGLAVAAGGIAVAINRSESLPTGPVPVVWNKTVCAECRMAVSERGYAAQLQTRDHQVLDFDDPGCLFRYVEQNAPSIHEIYFHHLREERWLSREQVAFVTAHPSPMAYDLGAVDLGVDSAQTFEEASGLPAQRSERGADVRH
jgi:copper chaperone NosL